MTLSPLPKLEGPPPFLGVAKSVTGKVWRDRLNERDTARALAITQRHQLPEMLSRVIAGRGIDGDRLLESLARRAHAVFRAAQKAAERRL